MTSGDADAGRAHGPDAALSRPAAMRAAMADYVTALHAAYLDQAAALAPAEQAALPLVTAAAEGPVSVVAVGTRHLHLLATSSALPRPAGQEVELTGEDRGLRWTLRFYDPTLLPALAGIAETDGPDPIAVRRALGVTDVVYHLSVAPGGGLSPHHAEHAGTGLANAHSAATRDFEALRACAPDRTDAIDEFAAAQRLGLSLSARLLARELAPGSAGVADATDPISLRHALLAALRPGATATGASERPGATDGND